MSGWVAKMRRKTKSFLRSANGTPHCCWTHCRTQGRCLRSDTDAMVARAFRVTQSLPRASEVSDAPRRPGPV